MKKARAWLEKYGIDYAFHDYRNTGSSASGWKNGKRKSAGKCCWIAQPRHSHRYDQDKAGLDAKKALALMLKQPWTIERTVLDPGGGKLWWGLRRNFTVRGFG